MINTWKNRQYNKKKKSADLVKEIDPKWANLLSTTTEELKKVQKDITDITKDAQKKINLLEQVLQMKISRIHRQ